MKIDKILECLGKFESVATEVATGGNRFDLSDQYTNSRKELLAVYPLRHNLPEWVQKYRNVSSFWDFIKIKYEKYVERRAFIADSLSGNYLEIENFHDENYFLIDLFLEEATKKFNSEHIQREWEKAIERRISDPDGAITLSKSMLESVCKHILDELKIDYSNERDLTLQKLYGIVAKNLRLSIQDITDVEIKKILKGFSLTIDGIARFRGLVGDAHGKGKVRYKISSRHAILAINSAFTLVIFLVDTFNERIDSTRLEDKT